MTNQSNLLNPEVIINHSLNLQDKPKPDDTVTKKNCICFQVNVLRNISVMLLKYSNYTNIINQHPKHIKT